MRIRHLLAALLFAPGLAQASVCQSFADTLPFARYVQPASLKVETQEALIRFVGHSTYLIELADGVTIATDFAGWAGPVADKPTVATMNHAHETHWTAYPSKEITHVLPGWNDAGGPIEHYLQLDEVLIRNVTTDIRGWGGGVEADGNSIFIFEIGDLCIGHLGHLHHVLTDAHFAEIGRLDVVMAAVDGGMTLNLPDMIALLKRVRASVVLPMHYFGSGTLEAFLAGMQDQFRIIRTDEPELMLSARMLPKEPSVIVLPPWNGVNESWSDD